MTSRIIQIHDVIIEVLQAESLGDAVLTPLLASLPANERISFESEWFDHRTDRDSREDALLIRALHNSTDNKRDRSELLDRFAELLDEVTWRKSPYLRTLLCWYYMSNNQHSHAIRLLQEDGCTPREYLELTANALKTRGPPLMPPVVVPDQYGSEVFDFADLAEACLFHGELDCALQNAAEHARRGRDPEKLTTAFLSRFIEVAAQQGAPLGEHLSEESAKFLLAQVHIALDE